MEAGVRTVGPPGQRATDTGPQSASQQTAYPQRISSSGAAGSGASPVHRPVDTPQSYSKGLLSSVQSSTSSSRSAASPLSPPRTGPGGPPTAFPPFPGREAPPTRYLQQPSTPYGSSSQVPYRENAYTRIPPQQQHPGNESYRLPTVVSTSAIGGGLVNSNGGSISTASIIDAGSKVVASGVPGPIGIGSSKYNSCSISNNISLPPPGSAVVGLVGQHQHHSVATSGAMVIESSSGSSTPSGRQRISLLPQSQPMDYEYSRHPGLLHQQQHQQQQHSQPPQHVGQLPQLHQVAVPTSQTLLAIHSSDLGGPPMTKRIRLANMENHHPSSPDINSRPYTSILKVDVSREPPMSSGSYHPQVEAISPTLPSDSQDEWRAMKDDLLQKIAKVDSDIQKVEKQIQNLRNEEESLKEASAKPPAAEEVTEIPAKNRSLAQIIYADNRRKASLAHGVLLPLGPPVDLPLYNQPSDVEACRKIIEKHEKFKQRLVRHFQYLKASRLQRNTAFAELYAVKSQDWQRRVEKAESTAKRKAKEAKNREFFEKVFPELRKQREDKERFNRVGSRVKSEADLEEIMDGLQEQALEDKKMRSYAVIPPLMLDSEQKRYPFMNENGLLMDIVADAKDREHMNVWTAGEKEIFKEKYLQHPKNFCAIAVNLDRKSVSDCVKFYYLSKKTENYKQLLRKARQRTRSSRNPQKAAPTQAPCIVDAMTTGVTTRLQREQQQKTGGRDRAANSASNNNASAVVVAIASAATCNNNSSASTSTASSSSYSSNSINIQVSTNNIMLNSTATTTFTSTVNNSNITSIHSTSSGVNVSVTASYSMNSTNAGALLTNAASAPVSSEVSTPVHLSHAITPTVAMETSGDSLNNSLNNSRVSGSPAIHGSDTGDTAMLTSATSSSVEHKQSLNHCDIGVVNRDKNHALDAVSVVTPDLAMEVDDPKPALYVPSGNWAVISGDEMNIKIHPNAEKTIAVKKDDGLDRVCAVCKTKSGAMIYLEKGRGHIYGIHEDAFFTGSYACPDCEQDMRSWRPASRLADRNYPMCPLPTCVNMSRRKRFRSIPSRLFDLPPEIRDPVLREFQIPEGTTECCEMCVMKIRKRTKKHFKATILTESELASMKNILAKWGPDWTRMEKMMGKPAKSLRIYFIDNKKTKKLGSIVQSYFAANPSSEQVSLTDGENTDWSSSDEEPEGTSDTASAESPNNPVGNTVSVSLTPKGDILGLHGTNLSSTILKSVDGSERLLPPHYMGKKHKISEECDSSATETADEENESSPANRHSPKGHLQFGNQTTITMVPSLGMPGLNGPIRDTPQNVQDVISDVIERGLKGPSLVPPRGPGNNMSMGVKSMMMMGNDRDREFGINRANEVMKGRGHNHHENSLATLSVVSHQQPSLGLPGAHLIQDGPPSNQVLSAHGLQNQIAATITPVPMSGAGTLSLPTSMSHSSSLQIIPSGIDKITTNSNVDNSMTVRLPGAPPQSVGQDNEPQTLDLSIKKRESGVFPPPKSIHNSTTIFRSENVMQPMYGVSETYPGYRMSKSPINNPPQPRRPPSGPAPTPGQQPISQQHHQFLVQQQQQQQQQKINLKLSPKQMGGAGSASAKSVGSITHGTPLNSLGGVPPPTMLIQGGSAPSPRVEVMMRQTPPDTANAGSNKIGSITQGTPLHGHVHLQGPSDGKIPPSQPQHPPTARSPYDGPANSRQSPAYAPGQPPQGSVYARSPGMPPYSGHESQQWSSRQILTNDYLTSQQMHRGGTMPQMASSRSDKESPSPSPRSSLVGPGPPSGSGQQLPPQGSVYYDKDQRSASRESLMSRSSPAAERMLHGSPSPMRTPPPPQRQGVIQRHNTSKSPSPASNRIPVMSHYPPPGHEALSSLVDVAVQQPLLPVPHKEEKSRNPTPTEQSMAMQQLRQMEIQRRHGGIPPSQQIYLREQQLDHLREQKQREHLAAAEREQDRVREIVDRERSRDRQVREMMDRERLSNSGPPIFGRDRPPMGPGARDGESLTAAILIDAIITHQITQSNADSVVPGRELTRPNFGYIRGDPVLHSHALPPVSQHPPTTGALQSERTGSLENNGKSHSPNVIKIDLDSDSSQPPTSRPTSAVASVKNITIGQITDSVIAKDFATNSLLSHRTPYGGMYLSEGQPPVSMGAPDHQWVRRLPSGPAVVSQTAVKDSKDASGRRVPTPDDRQIIRMAQTPSPRGKANPVPLHEPVSPPDDNSVPAATSVPPPSHYYSGVGSSISLQPLHGGPSPPERRPNSGPPAGAGSSGQTNFVLDCYVKNRIVEEMRIQEKGSGTGATVNLADRSSTPSNDEIRPSSRSSGTQLGHAYVTGSNAAVATTVAYPYSAWHVSGAPTGNHATVPPTSTAHKVGEPGLISASGNSAAGSVGSGGPPTEPKPLLSSQYEELSDEEDGNVN